MRKQSYDNAAFSKFDQEQERLNRQASILKEQELQWLIRQGIRQTDRVLDLGCGNGQTTAMLSEYLSAGSITGVDINTSFVAQAQERFRCHNLVYQQGSAYELEQFPAFDFIYSRLLFQHLSEPALALHQVWERLVPGGHCCIIDVNDDWLFLHPSLPAFDELVQAGIRQQQLSGGNRHIAAELPLLMRKEGFLDIRIEIIPFSSLQVGLEAFLDITLSFRANMIPSLMPLYQQVRQTLLANVADWFGMMGVFVITARKPG
ncbi:MAG: methyltransferase domain-containing protein [Chitinophagaceae bacterium]|nr:methyltransferase domain-containing protein [Chitinophagaceae bacterium]